MGGRIEISNDACKRRSLLSIGSEKRKRIRHGSDYLVADADCFLIIRDKTHKDA